MNKLLQKYIEKYKDLIDNEIEVELERRLKEVSAISNELATIVTAMQELSLGGKRLRGILTILGYELAGKKVDKEIIKAASMMEIFHLGLLIQDDFMDNDTKRRGVDTFLARYSDRHVADVVSTLAGDYTFGWGVEILSNLKLPITNLQIIRGMQVWGKYFTRVGYGQTLDCLKVADENTLMSILALKSGEYSCVLPLQLGASLGGADTTLQNKLYEYGMALGHVFQLRDDWLAEYGDSSKTGKPVGNDSREGKHSFATMYGKDKLESEIKRYTDEGKKSLQGLALKGDLKGEVMGEILEWMANREN